MGLAPTGAWRVPPIPHCNWRTLPSSQPPSLPALSFPLPPTPLGSFCKAPGGGGPMVGGGVLGRRGWRGGASKRHLGLDPHLGALGLKSAKWLFSLLMIWGFVEGPGFQTPYRALAALKALPTYLEILFKVCATPSHKASAAQNRALAPTNTEP